MNASNTSGGAARVPLSQRVRPDVETAPWVIEEIRRMERALGDLARLALLLPPDLVRRPDLQTAIVEAQRIAAGMVPEPRFFVLRMDDNGVDVKEFGSEDVRLEFLQRVPTDPDADHFALDIQSNGEISCGLAPTGSDARERMSERAALRERTA